MRVIGLGGGIACGKSSVNRILQANGIPVIDCDKLAHEGLQKGGWACRRVAKAFGPEILAPDGSVDRNALGRIIFADSAARRKLNAATHLPIAVSLLWRLFLHWLTFTPVVVVDMPLLFETGSHKYTTSSVVVWCSDERQVERLMARDGSSKADALARVAAQMPMQRKRALANFQLDNNGSLDQLQRQVDELAKQLKRGAKVWGLLTSPLLLAAAGGAIWSVLRALSRPTLSMWHAGMRQRLKGLQPWK